VILRRLTRSDLLRFSAICGGVSLCLWLAAPAFDEGLGLAAAATPTPVWSLSVAGSPSVLPVGIGHKGRFVAIVQNSGGAPTESGGIMHDVLPPGLTAVSAGANGCGGEGTREVTCPLPEQLPPGGLAAIYVEFEETGAIAAGSTLVNLASTSGGGAPEASSEDAIHAQPAGETGPGPAGIERFAAHATDLAGEPALQAGGHPSLFTTSLFVNSQVAENVPGSVRPVEATRDLVFYLPLGMLGDPLVADQCPTSLVETRAELTGCPPGSRIGAIMALVSSAGFAVEHGIYNVPPEKGYAAEFAFTSNGFTFVSYASVVKHDGTYMVRVATPGVPAASQLIGFVADFYGDPQEHFITNGEEETFHRGAFLTDPTNCAGGVQAGEASAEMDTWKHPNPTELTFKASSLVFPSLTGCESLSFGAALSARPETTQADSPSGLEVGLEVPQAPTGFADLGTPPIRDTVVKLPTGVTVSPSSANGLGACPETGPEGLNLEGPESEEVAEDGLERPAPGHCPLASQIATVHASTPLLHEELTGRMFLGQPACGGEYQPACTPEEAEHGNLVRLYMELEGPHSGIVVKLKGHATLQQPTGQLTASFEDLPQFPISDVVVTTKQGARAPLENPQACGPIKTHAVVTPWSPATPPAEPSSTFNVDWNGAGQGCPTSAPFAPTLSATTTIPMVAATSPFTLTLKRDDREQDINTVSTTLPEGMLAKIAGVARCPEPEASQDSLGACPTTSQIGTATAAVGPGSDPYYATGKVFFAGPYGGAPFSLSVIVPAQAGPFNLGDVLVRVKLFIDPHTAQATAVSDPLPQQLDGIPLRMRSLNVTLTDADFALNPTSCSRSSIDATVTSATGTSANTSTPFTAVGCDTLPFKPAFSTSTEARATKANGTGVYVKIAYPAGREANIAKLVIGFPKHVPVRLETLQKACLSATFEANPAACPTASDVGTATVHTPILAQPLTGPIYLVSHGSAKFPDAEVVLQGEGVTVEVDGQSFVSSSGALKATFASVPDAPFSSFEAVLPPGPHSQFTSVRTSGKAQGSQCGENLVVPVTLVAHDGAEISKNTKMEIVGCPPSVSIERVEARAHGLAITLKTTARGRLKIGGHGLKTLVKRDVPPGTLKLTVAFSPAGRKATHKHGKITLTVGLVAGKSKASAHRNVAV
jgi:hypothetical protein